VAADELTDLDVALELLREIAATLFFGLATTVGEENVRNSDTVFIFTVQDFHGLDGLRDSLSATDEDAVDIESKDKRVGDGIV
jgi:hypothetical protein